MKNQGFTIVELLVSIGILLIIYTLSTISLTRLPSSASQSSTIDGLITDLRAQQTLSMSGYNNASYGISFTGNSYTLFPNTFTVNLDPTIKLSETFSGDKITFAAGSGNTTAGTITITNTYTGEAKTININQYGATH